VRAGGSKQSARQRKCIIVALRGLNEKRRKEEECKPTTSLEEVLYNSYYVRLVLKLLIIVETTKGS